MTASQDNVLVSVAADVGAGVLLTSGGAVSVGVLLRALKAGLGHYEAEQRARGRARRAQAAMTEASLEQDWFASEEISGTVDEILAVADEVWRDGHVGSATQRKDRSYIERWAHSMAADIGAGVRLAGEPTVDILGVINRPGESEDRIVLRVRLRLSADRAQGWGHAHADLRWTLGRRNHAWTLLSIDTDPLAEPLMKGPLIPAQWADDERLLEESLAELAEDDADHTVNPSELVSADLSAAQQLIELASVDGRFDPELLDARIRHIVGAWEEASTGSSAPLAAAASHQTVGLLLYPPLGDRPASTRLVLRDAVIERWTATELAISSVLYQITIALLVSATGYLVNWPDGTYRSGNIETRHEINLVWTLGLTNSRTDRWRLISTTNPAQAVPDINGPARP